MLQYKIEFPVGDWSDDGHGKCEYYKIESNKSVEELAAIHRKIPEVLGFDIGDIASEYEDSTVSGDIVNILIDRNFNFKEYIEDFEWAVLQDSRAGAGLEEDEEIEVPRDEPLPVTSESVFNIWVWALKEVDPTFEYKEVNSEFKVMYGVSTPGYGCFY